VTPDAAVSATYVPLLVAYVVGAVRIEAEPVAKTKSTTCPPIPPSLARSSKYMWPSPDRATT
jgi:hypothetical protein